jgi:hypothetical protein
LNLLIVDAVQLDDVLELVSLLLERHHLLVVFADLSANRRRLGRHLADRQHARRRGRRIGVKHGPAAECCDERDATGERLH